MLKTTLKSTLIAAMLTGIALPVFADDAGAPVYDADSMSSQYDEPQTDADGQAVAPQQAQTQAPAATPSPSTSSPRLQVQRDSSPSDQSGDVSTKSLSLEQRMRRVEQQVNNMQSNGSSDKVEQLQNEVQSLRGQVDELNHKLQQMQAETKEQHETVADLEKRFSKQAEKKQLVEETDSEPKSKVKSQPDQSDTIPAKTLTKTAKAAKTAAASTATEKGSDEQPNIAEEQQTYQTAYDLIKAKKYNDAITALQSMLQKYPSGQFAANAHYWLGELYGLTGKNDQAAIEFSNVVKNFPDSPKVADAQLKLGLIYASQSKWSDAKTTLKKVMNNYPGTASARLALEQLKQIKKAGH